MEAATPVEALILRACKLRDTLKPAARAAALSEVNAKPPEDGPALLTVSA